MSISSETRHAFNFYRSNGFTAARALQGARMDNAKGISRYTSSPWHKPCGNGIATDGAQWIEKPASMGLRFAGYCDEIYSHIEHTGWFTDPYQESRIRGVVYQLPGRDGKARFVAGHDNADNGKADCGGPAYVDFSQIYESDFAEEMRLALRGIGKQYQNDAMLKPGYWAEGAHESAKREAARAADGFAESHAEKEREYQTPWQAGNMYADCLEELAAVRKSVLATIADIKGACETLKALPASIRARLKASLESDIEQRSEIFSKMEKLASGDYGSLIFYPGESEKAAFNEGAGKAVL